MADSLTPITSDKLSKVTTAKDTDLVTLGINGNFVVMTLANLKEVLGINALNTNTQPISKGDAEFSGNWSGVVSHVQIGEVHLIYGMISHNSDTPPDWGEKVCKLPNYANAYWMPVSAFRISGYILDAFAITTDGEIHVYSPDYGQIKNETYHIMAVAQTFKYQS